MIILKKSFRNYITGVRCDTKPSDTEASVLDFWEKQSTHSLPLLPGPLGPGGRAPDRVLSMSQIEPFDI